MHPRLDLIDLDQPGLEGYRRFISCWLSREHGPSFVVDPGPASTAGHLVARLCALGVERLDLVLLTHIHLDHGGGLADILDAFPGARVACHPRARKHLTDPSRLWEGSRAVLGELADRYGAPRPVPDTCLIAAEELEALGVATIETPGHAPHHVSFLHAGTLFVGEAAGTFLALPDGAWYLRPATPPRFVLDVALASLDRLLALAPAPARLAFAHHGLLDGASRELLRQARAQHLRWVETVRGVRHEQPDASLAEIAATVLPRLRAGDRLFARGDRLPPDIATREEDFTLQTLRGMVQFVDTEAGTGSAANG